ncbi:MAG: hypothetical protein HPY55_04595 [Firmicutes bacterium]|nr:hypothetical protein [Bacillota bacterium]
MQVCGQGLELSVFAGGPDADAALQARDPHRYFTRRIVTLYPGYADEALRTRFVTWPRDPWTMTGYSFPAPGQVTTILPVLNSPFHERLFFAGEATSPDFFGFMEGALQSGLFAALRILRQAGIFSELTTV